MEAFQLLENTFNDGDPISFLAFIVMTGIDDQDDIKSVATTM